VYYGDLSKIKSFDDFLSFIKRFCLALSTLFFCFYLWGSYFSQPLEYSDLTELEGFVIEKWRSKGPRAPEVYRLRVKTDDGIKQFRINSRLVANCCFLEEIPLNKKVSVLTNWSIEGINLYQITLGNKVLLNAHDVIAREDEKIVSYLPFSLVLFLIGGFAYCLELFRKDKKSE
jgi:hypothetical protein